MQGRQLSVKGLLDTGAVVSVMQVKTWTDKGFERSDLKPTNIRLAAANQGAIYVTGRTPIISLQLGGRHLWTSFLVVENLDESDQFILGRDFVRNFDVTIDLNDGLIRIKDPERKYEKKPLSVKETYDKLPLTRWLDKSGHSIPGHPDLPVETAAGIKVLARGEPVPLDLLVRSKLVQQELTRLGINSMALLNRTVNVAPDVMGKLRDLLDREVDRHDRERMETMQRLTVTERTEKRPVSLRSRDVERDCRSIVKQLVSSMPKEVLLRTLFTEHGTLNQTQATEEVRIKSRSSFARKVHFTDAREEYEPSPDCSPGDETMSGESDTFEPVKDESSEELDTFEPVQDDLSGERLTRLPSGRTLSRESDSKRPMDREFCPEGRETSQTTWNMMLGNQSAQVLTRGPSPGITHLKRLQIPICQRSQSTPCW